MFSGDLEVFFALLCFVCELIARCKINTTNGYDGTFWGVFLFTPSENVSLRLWEIEEEGVARRP